MWLGVLYIGLVMAAATLLTIDSQLPGGLLPGSGTIDEARTMGFTVLVLAQLFNALNARSPTKSAFRQPLANPFLIAGIAVSLALQVLVVHAAIHERRLQHRPVVGPRLDGLPGDRKRGVVGR